ncbi:MAG: transketolase [Candidatus Diapherotrites archaeon]|nr:transketolase [Candidatus Diapherotrites archaeon]
MDSAGILKLQHIAQELRRDIVRMIGAAGSGHPGGSLSAADLVSALYFHALVFDPKNPDWSGRDYFFLSKGHVCPVQYAAMARAGFFPREELLTLRRMGSRLQGHPDMRKLPGIEVSAGSLGQGLSVSVGVAAGLRMDGLPNKVYCLLGDGELDEGQVWEAAMSAAHYNLSNLCALVDRNGLQIDGPTGEVMELEPLADKWRAFGWRVIELDGHDLGQIVNALDEFKSFSGNQPTVLIARTVKGKGVSFMENKADWHGKAPGAEEVRRALAELGCPS